MKLVYIINLCSRPHSSRGPLELLYTYVKIIDFSNERQQVVHPILRNHCVQNLPTLPPEMWSRIFYFLTPRERFAYMNMCKEFSTAAVATLNDVHYNIFENENRNVETEINLGFKCNPLANAIK